MQRENCKLSSTSREQNLKCPRCGKKMRILIDKVKFDWLCFYEDWLVSYLSQNVIFQCNSELSCPNKERCHDKQRFCKLTLHNVYNGTFFIYRYNCFLCDFDICIVCGSTLEEENVGELEVESLYDKMLRFSESPVRQHQPVRVTSLRTLCLTSDKSRQANVRSQTIVLRETATNTEPLSPCGPSEIWNN